MDRGSVRIDDNPEPLVNFARFAVQWLWPVASCIVGLEWRRGVCSVSFRAYWMC